MTSIIIPAHNEAAVIERCLKSLEISAIKNKLEVYVVCNGCVDNTADLARKFEYVTVIDIPTASKIAALNAGDDAATTYPRVYFDADVLIEGDSLINCINSMSDDEQVGAPVSNFEL